MNIAKRIRRSITLARLQRTRAKAFADRDTEAKKLKAAGQSDDEALNTANAFWKNEIRACYANIAVFLSDQLIEQAETLDILVPNDERYWTKLKYASKTHLSHEGRMLLRTQVREEQKTRREAAAFWFNIITVLLSLVVAILALAKSH